MGNVLNKKYEEPGKPVREKTKVKRKRKPMTAEQKAAAGERLAKARAAKGPSKHVSVDITIRTLPEDHFLSPTKVKSWIKVWQDKLKSMKTYRDSKDRDQRRTHLIGETYLKNMKSYLGNGIWSDSHYGEDRENEIKFLVIAPAYHEDGTMKRTKGFFYRDVGFWNEETADET